MDKRSATDFIYKAADLITKTLSRNFFRIRFKTVLRRTSFQLPNRLLAVFLEKEQFRVISSTDDDSVTSDELSRQ
jgi:hypothetical protein